MKRFLVFWLSAVACALIAVMTLGGGVADAAGPDYSGQTYGKASQQISSGGSTPVIASVVGDQLATDDCIVTSSSKASNLDSSGRSRGNQILLHLNCELGLAAPGKPGNSAASPGGQQEKAKQEVGIKYDTDYQNAVKAGQVPWCASHADNCKQVCDQSGTCSADFLNYLAGL